MSYNSVVFAGPLTNVNTAAAGALGVLGPLLSHLDFTLFGSVGLGALQADLQAQLSAALQASVSISIGITNPLAGFQQALAGIAALQAEIARALAGAIPTISVEATAQLSALASFSSLLSAQVGGLEGLIQGGVAVKVSAVNFAGPLRDALLAGPVFILSFENVPLSVVGTDIAGDFGAGLNYGPNNISTFDSVYGLVLVTKVPSAWSALQATMRTV